jgi:hypothetical protein
MRRFLAIFLLALAWVTVVHAQVQDNPDDFNDYEFEDEFDFTEALPEVQPEASPDLLNRWLYLGLRGGGSFRFHTLPELTMDYYSYMPGLTYEVAFQAAFRFLPFMSVQAEAVFTHDRAKFRGTESHQLGDRSWFIYYTDTYSSTSLMFPLTVKFPLVAAPYIVAPFVGAYWAMPLGKMTLASNIASRPTGEFDYKLSGHFGLTAGVDLGINLGPGILFLDARYGGDFGEVVIQVGDSKITYKRVMLSLSIGYEIALLDKKQGARGN